MFSEVNDEVIIVTFPRIQVESHIPDFTYKLVRIHDYSNEELLENEDEMSLLMMLGKAQTPEDVHRLIHAQKDKVEMIIKRRRNMYWRLSHQQSGACV